MKSLLPTLALLSSLEGCALAPPAVTKAVVDPLAAPELARGFELRDRYGLPKHLGVTAIYIDTLAVHHTHYEASTIAWRDKQGSWQWTQAVESGPGGLLPVVERKLNSERVRTLTRLEAQAIELLIRDPGLYSGTVERTGEVGIGAPSHVMGIVTPFGRRLIRWDGRLVGPGGKLADILLGHE